LLNTSVVVVVVVAVIAFGGGGGGVYLFTFEGNRRQVFDILRSFIDFLFYGFWILVAASLSLSGSLMR
jgi:hypothetical protein